MRDRAYFRYQRAKVIQRKKHISCSVYGFDWYRGTDGKYSKGKIYCGCGLCKFGRKYGLPTVKRMREDSKVKIELKEYYARR